MQINKELTNKYYEDYIPCNCGDCRYFIKHIETEKPELCEYLRTLGINPLTKTIYELKPFYKRGIKKSVKQISNYNDLLGGGFKMIIVVY